jgi:hypothetical protein
LVSIETLVNSSVNVTAASATTAPLGSLTVPVMVATVESCARSAAPVMSTKNSATPRSVTVEILRRKLAISYFLVFS